jgi:hypothetical protein
MNLPQATALTSSIIKRSLHDLRERLNSMRRDKDHLENGLQEYENSQI